MYNNNYRNWKYKKFNKWNNKIAKRILAFDDCAVLINNTTDKKETVYLNTVQLSDINKYIDYTLEKIYCGMFDSHILYDIINKNDIKGLFTLFYDINNSYIKPVVINDIYKICTKKLNWSLLDIIENYGSLDIYNTYETALNVFIRNNEYNEDKYNYTIEDWSIYFEDVLKDMPFDNVIYIEGKSGLFYKVEL